MAWTKKLMLGLLLSDLERKWA